MPRRARAKSGSGIYHVVLKGINRQAFFDDEEDYHKFIFTLKKCKGKSGFDLYGYCLMSNHIHILLKEGSDGLEVIFRRIGTSYVYWYNHKYERCGHLFQDRYKSEAVEDDSYFLTVLRYIHRNPLSAGITSNLSEYPWSSYREYTEEKGICNTGFALRMFSKDPGQAVALFKEFNMQGNDDKCLEYDDSVRLSDSEAREKILNITGISNIKKIQTLPSSERNKNIKMLKENGLSIRQIERLTGVSYAVIRRC